MIPSRVSGTLLIALLACALPGISRAATRVLPVVYDSGLQRMPDAGEWQVKLQLPRRPNLLLRIYGRDVDVVVALAGETQHAGRSYDAIGSRWGREYLCVDGRSAATTGLALRVSARETGNRFGRLRVQALDLTPLGGAAGDVCAQFDKMGAVVGGPAAQAAAQAAQLAVLAQQLTQSGGTDLICDAWISAAQLRYYTDQAWNVARQTATAAEKSCRTAGRLSEANDAFFTAAASTAELAQLRPGGADAAQLHQRLVQEAVDALLLSQRRFLAEQRPAAAARALNDAAIVLVYESRFRDAERQYLLAQTLATQIDDRLMLLKIRANLGSMLARSGQPRRAAKVYDTLLADEAVQSRPELRLSWLQNAALPRVDLGDYAEALRLYLQALDLSRALEDAPAERRALHGIGRVYSLLGDPRQAENFLERALAIAKRTGDTGAELSLLTSIGDVQRSLDNLPDATRLHRRAVALGGSPAEMATTRLTLSEDLLLAGDVQAALDELDLVRALPLEKSHPFQLRAQLQRARALRLAQQYVPAEQQARQVIRQFTERGLVPWQLAARIELQRILRASGRLDAALAAARETNKLFAHQWLGADNSAIRASFRASHDALYQEWISAAVARALQMESGGDRAGAESVRREALLAANFSRGYELRLARAQASSGNSEQTQAGDVIYEALAGRYAVLERAAERSALVTPQMRVLQNEIADLEARAANARRSQPAIEVEEVQARTRLRDLQRNLRAGETLVFYQTGASESWMWVATATGLQVHVLPRAAELRGLMDRALTLVQQRSDPAAARAALAAAANAAAVPRILESYGAARVSRAMLLVDAELGRWPWTFMLNAQIPGGAQPVAVEMLASLPSRVRPTVPAQPRAVLFGDPVYGRNDPRLPRRAVGAPAELPGDLQRLASTSGEVQSVAGLLDGMPVQRFVGLAANRNSLLQLRTDRNLIVHLATHGFENASEPLLSRLVFSRYDAQGNKIAAEVTARQLALMHWRPWLVVLSACETASGAGVVGEGVISTSRAVLASGAQQVVGTLWAVSDSYTATLMKEFYRELILEKFDVSLALARAQRSLLTTEGDRALSEVISFTAFRAGD